MGIHLAAFAATETVKNAEIEGKKWKNGSRSLLRPQAGKKMVSIDPK
jgi:hypothetical protein